MGDLFAILPEAILYIASGFAFLCGFYLLVDRRLDFFSEISFWIMLVIGFVCTNIMRIPNIDTSDMNVGLKNIIVLCGSFVAGIVIAGVQKVGGDKINRLVIKMGRRKSSTAFFWYELLDKKDKPIWLRLKNIEKGYVLEGVLLAIDEAKENPYLLLGYCKKYDLEGKLLENEYAESERVQCVVRADSYDEIVVIYDEQSEKIVKLDIH